VSSHFSLVAKVHLSTSIIEMLLELDRLNAQGRLDLPAMQRLAAEYRVVLIPEKKI
jgi:hypothetical protein